MIYWEFLGDRYDTYEEAYEACCDEVPEECKILEELSRYSPFEILDAIQKGDIRLYEEIIDSLNEERANDIIEIEEIEEEDEEETQFSSFLIRRITSNSFYCQIFNFI